MLKRKFHDFRQTYSAVPFFILLILILLRLLLPPYLDGWVSIRILLDAFLTAILFALMYAVRSDRCHVIIGTMLALPIIFTVWASYFIEITSFGLTTRIFSALFFGYMAVNILRMITKQKEVTRETIFAAIVAYLLIALMWAFLYMVLEKLAPGSFAFPEKAIRS
jgi:hypothetical protein